MTNQPTEDEEITATIIQMRRDDKKTALKLGAAAILLMMALALIGSGLIALSDIFSAALTGK